MTPFAWVALCAATVISPAATATELYLAAFSCGPSNGHPYPDPLERYPVPEVGLDFSLPATWEAPVVEQPGVVVVASRNGQVVMRVSMEALGGLAFEDAVSRVEALQFGNNALSARCRQELRDAYRPQVPGRLEDALRVAVGAYSPPFSRKGPRAVYGLFFAYRGRFWVLRADLLRAHLTREQRAELHAIFANLAILATTGAAPEESGGPSP
jgi:hypothetical protein